MNDKGAALALLTLTIDAGGVQDSEAAFTTSDAIGLGAEYFREIRTDAPAIEVATNGLRAACGADTTVNENGDEVEGSGCDFTYSEDYTPTVDAIEPAVAHVDTMITITGTGFARESQLNTVCCVGRAHQPTNSTVTNPGQPTSHDLTTNTNNSPTQPINRNRSPSAVRRATWLQLTPPSSSALCRRARARLAPSRSRCSCTTRATPR